MSKQWLVDAGLWPGPVSKQQPQQLWPQTLNPVRDKEHPCNNTRVSAWIQSISISSSERRRRNLSSGGASKASAATATAETTATATATATTTATTTATATATAKHQQQHQPQWAWAPQLQRLRWSALPCTTVVVRLRWVNVQSVFTVHPGSTRCAIVRCIASICVPWQEPIDGRMGWLGLYHIIIMIWSFSRHVARASAAATAAAAAAGVATVAASHTKMHKCCSCPCCTYGEGHTSNQTLKFTGGCRRPVCLLMATR